MFSGYSVYLSEYIEEEWFNIVVQGFMIQEQFDQQAEVLTIDLVCITIHLEY